MVWQNVRPKGLVSGCHKMKLELHPEISAGYLDIYLNTVISAWMCLAIISVTFAFASAGTIYQVLPLAIIIALFFSGILTLIFASLLAASLWLCYIQGCQFRSTLALAPSCLTAVLMAGIIVCFLPMNFPRNTIDPTWTGAIVLIIASICGSLVGLVGLQSANKKQSHDNQ